MEIKSAFLWLPYKIKSIKMLFYDPSQRLGKKKKKQGSNFFEVLL